MVVYVINQHGKPLMPCKPSKAKKLLRAKKAKVIKHNPFTIQLLYGSSGYKQDIKLGIDSGYQNIGFSAITDKEEVIAGEVKMLSGMPERNEKRRMYRRNRRSRKRHRKKRFNNRVKTKKKGWLAPSIQHKLDTHRRWVNQIKSILPISKIIIEVANFDIQKIKNPNIESVEYQQGEQKGFTNTREYILHRDSHSCQNPHCKGNSEILHVHHIDMNRTNNHISNLITLCHNCHTPTNHKGFLKNWKPKSKAFKSETFMSIVRWRLVNELKCEYTYGFLTKQKRFNLSLPKSHINDAFVIADGTEQHRSIQYQITQNRRNNRSLEYFYDATYLDGRDRKKKKGAELFCGRTTRNKEKNSENLRQYRLYKVRKGRRSIRKSRPNFQPNDLVRHEGKLYRIAGSHNKGTRVILQETKKSVSIKKIEIVKYAKGLCWEKAQFLPS